MPKLIIQRGEFSDLVAFTCLVKDLYLKGRIDNARNVLSWVESNGYKCNEMAYYMLINEYCESEMLKEAQNFAC